MAKDNTLSRLFIRTGRDAPGLSRHKRPTISGRDALLATMAARWPDAPLRANQRRKLSARQAQLEVLAMALDPVSQKPYGKPLTDKQQQVEAMRHKSSRQKWLETDAMRED